MKIFFYLTIILNLKCVMSRKTAQTLSLREKVDLLKLETSQDVLNKQEIMTSTNDDYVSREDNIFPITPVNDFDAKNDGRYRYKEFKPTTPDDTLMLHTDLLKSKTKSNNIRKPIEMFYRRHLSGEIRNKPNKFMHCQELVTPILNGMKSNISDPKVLNADDTTVRRLIQLINLNTTEFTKDEVVSVLYQISNLQLRLFRWEVNAIKLLLNTLTYGKNHTFRTVKNGLKNLFYNRWFLDLSNTTNLVLQTRIFRPPCVRSSADTGSTLTTRVQRYKKPRIPPKCRPLDMRTECRSAVNTD